MPLRRAGDGERCAQTIRSRLGQGGDDATSTATFIASQRTDHVAPMGSVEPGHGQTYEQVAQPGGMERAGVVGGVERHCRLGGSVVEAESLGFGGELVCYGSAFGVVDALVVHEVLEQDPAHRGPREDGQAQQSAASGRTSPVMRI